MLSFFNPTKDFIKNIIKKISLDINRVIGIDLGTVNTLIYTNTEGLVVNQSSAVAYIVNEGIKTPYLYGNRAKHMFGKTPLQVEVISPLIDGVVADYQMSEEMISYFFSNILRKRMTFIRPKVVVGIPLNATSVEKQAIQNVIYRSGASEVFLVYESIAAAIGARAKINDPSASMIVDIGGGTTEISVISLGGVVTGKSIRVAGNKIDQAILDYIKKKYHLIIGITTAEEVKINLGVACFRDGDKIKEMKVRGRDAKIGTPKAILLNQEDMIDAVTPILSEILKNIKEILELSPPELASDVVERGIILCGGGANIKNLDFLISNLVSLPVFIPHKPEFCVIKGIAEIVENINDFKHLLYQEN